MNTAHRNSYLLSVVGVLIGLAAAPLWADGAGEMEGDTLCRIALEDLSRTSDRLRGSGQMTKEMVSQVNNIFQKALVEQAELQSKDPQRDSREISQVLLNRHDSALAKISPIHFADLRDALSLKMRQASDRREARNQAIQKTNQELVPYLTDPGRFMAKGSVPPLTQFQRKALAKAAYEFYQTHTQKLPEGGAADRTHYAEHLEFLQDKKVRAALNDAGIDPKDIELLVLLHDLGKNFHAMPEAYRDMMEEASEGNPLHREIMGHELGSMFQVEELIKDFNIQNPAHRISEAQKKALLALIARHNAGYSKGLPGFHFWEQAWPAFAEKMRESGIVLPELYPAVAKASDGGREENIILTAIDRLVSLTLSSQEKFARFAKFTNDGMADQMEKNSEAVPLEGVNVLENLNGFFPPSSSANAEEIKAAILEHAGKEVATLTEVSGRLRAMGRGTAFFGKNAVEDFSDKPSGALEGDGIVYRTRPGRTNPGPDAHPKPATWYKIERKGLVSGDLYEGQRNPETGALEWVKIDSVGQTNSYFFRELLFPDMGFSPAQLEPPAVASE